MGYCATENGARHVAMKTATVGTDMNCSDVYKQLSAYFDGELPLAERPQMAAHLSSCSECNARLGQFETLSTMAKRLPEPAAPNFWASIERELGNMPSPAPNPATIGIEWRRRLQRRVLAVAGVAAALILAAVLSYPYLQSPKKSAEMAMNLTGYIEAFHKDPEQAQQSLLAKYKSQAVQPDEVVTLIHYKLLAPEKLPSGLTRTAMYEIDMPCCKCVESVYRRADGRMLAVFEHADKEPASFGDRPTVNAQCHGKDVGLVHCDGQLCANWKEQERFVTVIGANELAEVDEIVAAFEPAMRM